MTRPYLFLEILAVILIVAIVAESYQYYKIERINSSISHAENLEVTEDSAPEIIFAKAWYFNREGKFQEALQLYHSIEDRVTAQNLEKVKYNIGQIYLTQAAKHWNSQGVWAYSHVVTWSSLAAKTFREVVVKNPSHWDARFNLEYVLRIAPPPREVDKADWKGRRSSVHSIYPGIPGGGP